MAGAGLPSGGGSGSLGVDIATGEIQDGAVTLAKMANLAQDLFIGRTTASTGVPETATITAAARTVLDDATVAAMVDTLGGAAAQGSGGIVRATSPTLTTPNLGTPSAGVLTSCTGTAAGLTAGAATLAADSTKVANTTPGAGGLAVLDDASTDAILTTLGFPANFMMPTSQRKILPHGCQQTAASFLTIAGTAYFCYLGQTARAFTPKYIAAHLNVVATTDSVGELGFFTTPLPPNKAGQTLTPIAGAFKTAWDDLTSGGGAAIRRVGNAVAMATSVPAGVHLWAGIRTNTGGNEPSFTGVILDVLGGNILALAGAAAFDGTTAYAGAVPAIAAAATTAVGPYFWAEMD